MLLLCHKSAIRPAKAIAKTAAHGYMLESTAAAPCTPACRPPSWQWVFCFLLPCRPHPGTELRLVIRWEPICSVMHADLPVVVSAAGLPLPASAPFSSHLLDCFHPDQTLPAAPCAPACRPLSQQRACCFLHPRHSHPRRRPPRPRCCLVACRQLRRAAPSAGHS